MFRFFTITLHLQKTCQKLLYLRINVNLHNCCQLISLSPIFLNYNLLIIKNVYEVKLIRKTHFTFTYDA